MHSANLHRRTTRKPFALTGCLAAIVVACSSGPRSASSVKGRTTLVEFRKIDSMLDVHRDQMCRELGREPRPKTVEAPLPWRAGAFATEAEQDRGCDAGTPAACFYIALRYWRAEGVDRRGAALSIDPERARTLFRKSCDGRYDNGCLWLNSLMRDHDHDHAGRVALVRELVDTNRDALAALLWTDLKEDERPLFAPSLRAFRDRLELACKGGSAAACDARAQLECAPSGQCAPGDVPWRTKACRLGSSVGCQLAFVSLDPSQIERTEAVERSACSDGTCAHLVADLVVACDHGAWPACYVAANACDHGSGVARPFDHTVNDLYSR